MRRMGCSFWLGTVMVFGGPPACFADHYFNSAGVKIHYVTQGQGEAVVLVHGWAVSLTMWGKNRWGDNLILPTLARDFRVIALDCRGHGKSDKPHDPAAYGPPMAEDVVRLLDHLQVRTAHVVGYSMGAVLAGYLVAHHPDRVRSVVFGGGAPVLKWDKSHLQKSEDFLKKWQEDKGLQALSRLLLGEQDREALALANRSLHQITVTADALRKYRGPVLFLYGSQEWDSTKHYVAEARKVFGRGEVVVIPGADHFTAPSRPEFRQALVKFLRAQQQGGGIK